MSSERRPKVGLVCSHGGHLTEMLELQDAFDGYDTFYYCYEGDTTRRLPKVYLTPNRPKNPFHVARNFVRLWKIFGKERPDFIVSTGAEIAIPAFLLAKLRGIPTLYIECGAQVTTPSITGRLLVHVAGTFLVQWPELQERYGKRAAYQGSLVDETPPVS